MVNPMAKRWVSSVSKAANDMGIKVRGVSDLSEQQKFVRILRSAVADLQRGHSKEGEVFYNKMRFKERLAKARIRIPETYGYLRRYKEEDYKTFWAGIEGKDSFVYKPNHLSQGRHIYSIQIVDGQMLEPDGAIRTADFFEKTTKKILNGRHVHRGVYMEERLYCHESLREWYDSDGIADLRVYMLCDVPLYGKLRLPTKKSHGYGNTGRNATAYYVDFETMEIGETRFMSNISRTHPDTGVNLIGESMPFCQEFINASVRVAKLFKLPFHSVDMTVNEKGEVVVIEGEKIPLLRHFTKSGVIDLLQKMEDYTGTRMRGYHGMRLRR